MRPCSPGWPPDGRASYAALAAKTGWNGARVARRVERLLGDGTVFLDIDLAHESLGFHVRAVLWLRVRPTDLEATGRQLAAHEEIAFVGAVTGQDNLMATIICRDDEHLYRYLVTRIADIAAIRSYELLISMRRFKDARTFVSRTTLSAATGR
ncbi:MAG: Lrp/AsnC family transcriptional regulator [Mycobacteriales bacterium]